MWLVCAGINGYSVRHIGWPARVGYVLSGLALMTPRSMFEGGDWVDLGGLVLGVALLAWDWTAARRAKAEGRAAPAAPAPTVSKP